MLRCCLDNNMKQQKTRHKGSFLFHFRTEARGPRQVQGRRVSSRSQDSEPAWPAHTCRPGAVLLLQQSCPYSLWITAQTRLWDAPNMCQDVVSGKADLNGCRLGVSAVSVSCGNWVPPPKNPIGLRYTNSSVMIFSWFTNSRIWISTLGHWKWWSNCVAIQGNLFYYW